MKLLSETLRQAVRDSGLSLYRIAAETGLDLDVLSRFMKHQARMRIDHADRLAAFLGLELRKAAGKGSGRKG